VVQKLDAEGRYQLIHSPSLVILRNKWAELKLDPENGENSIELKLKYENFKPVEDDNTALKTPSSAEPDWLNWGGKSTVPTELC